MASALKIILPVVLTAAVASGATLYFANQGAIPFLSDAHGQSVHEKESVAHREAAAPLFVDLEPFTVMLEKDGSPRRVFYTAITIKVKDKHSTEQLEQYQPEVRDRILQVLSAQDPKKLQTPEGRASLSSTLTRSLSAPFVDTQAAPRIDRVLFTQYLVQ